jgi:hypothetical protein
MAHPYSGHKQEAVGHRRVKVLMRSGGYAEGHSIAKAAKSFAKRVAAHESAEEKHEGEYAQGGRIDKRARGGKITPSKHRPHVSVNIINAHHRPPMPLIPPGGGAGLGAAPPMPLPPPGAGAGAPLPGMKRGGRASAYISGVSSGENLKSWKGYASRGTVKYATGGRTESLASLPNGGPADRLSPEAKSPGGSRVGAHSEPRLRGDRGAWADKLGGTERVRQLGKMRTGKHFGATTGPANISSAKSQKSSYP